MQKTDDSMYAIAEAIGVSRRRVQQLHHRAIEKLRVGLAAEGIDYESVELFDAARSRLGRGKYRRRLKGRLRSCLG
jgi:hypothetical protein